MYCTPSVISTKVADISGRTLTPRYAVKAGKEEIALRNRSKSIFVRVTDDEKRKIEKNAARCGLSVSEYIRKASIGKEVKSYPVDAFFSLRKSLEQIYTDFHDGMSKETEQELIKTLAEMNRTFLLPERERR